MSLIRKLVQYVLIVVLALCILVPSVAYVLLSTDWAQEKIRTVAQNELTSFLGSDVEIGRVSYKPFNVISVEGVSVRDDSGRKMLGIGRLQARFELLYFLRKGRMIVDYAVVDYPEFYAWRESPSSELNLQPLFDRFKKKNNDQSQTKLDLKIGVIILHNGRLTYDVLSEPATDAKFNASHVRVDDLNLHAYLRQLFNDGIDVEIESLSLKEQSGFELTDLTANMMIGEEGTVVSDLELKMPSSCLKFKPITLPARTFSELSTAFNTAGLRVATAGEPTVQTADFAAFAPVLGKLALQVRPDFDVYVTPHDIVVDKMDLCVGQGIKAVLAGSVENLNDRDKRHGQIKIKSFDAQAGALADLLAHFDNKMAEIAKRVGRISLQGVARADMKCAETNLELNLGNGKIETSAKVATPDGYGSAAIDVSATIDDVNLGGLLAENRLGNVKAKFNGSARVDHGLREASGQLDVEAVRWDKHTFKRLEINGDYTQSHASVQANSHDAYCRFDLNASMDKEDGRSKIDGDFRLHRLALDSLGVKFFRPGFDASASVAVALEGSSLNDIEGRLALRDIKVKDEKRHLEIKNFLATMTRGEQSDRLELQSDIINGSVEGEINPTSLPSIFKDMAWHVAPNLFVHDESLHTKLDEQSLHNRFTADFTIDAAVDLCNYLELPIRLIYPVELVGTVDSEQGLANVNIDVPYLEQGDKIIDSTVAGAYIDTSTNRMGAYATTRMPTKKGPMTMVVGVAGSNNRFDTHIDWEIERAIPLNGLIDFSTLLDRSDNGSVCAITNLNPGQINFGDDVWDISPSVIGWCDNILSVDDFKLTAGAQQIDINGRGSASENDVLKVALKDINMISIFETLEINNAMIGGIANGSVEATKVLSGLPVMTTDNLHVDSISYNHCVIGTADVGARWNNEKQAVSLNADIINPQGELSRVYGDIYVASESLDLYFDAKRVRIGFMQPFMEAFASEVSGYGSGKAHLYGTFHDIDMEGDLYADNMRIKIDFTNTEYLATDSVHIVPGLIELDNITIYDTSGHKATLSGWLKHKYFHLPEFDFKVTNARNFLCYNVTEAMNPDWYGTVYGNGSATVEGRPGVVNIGASMSTAPGSTFTFVLSDRLEAEQYSFITFRDVTELSVEEQLAAEDVPEAVKQYNERLSARNSDKPSDYNLDFRIDVTPDAQMIIVMDPVGGDRIRSYGNGDIRLTYNSTDNDIRMYGQYNLERGNYNFTLQDIIIKDFIIDAGSSIAFHGDPYSAVLDIEAAYQLNANLTDLDESFAMDKDLNRTNVPVQALLKVSGDMRQPDLDFDLRFPTLTSDIYRKVKSIISTDEMMNRQIIYLLALNRFYTPDYMESTTKGSELFAVASSTLSSQLSNILGKLSDNWTIAPNLRSDRGDFSDIEVDVALSSRLLNNRLLLNGNLGYRDKSLNTNQFVGDFDIEYLLNRRGNWRLKGYSRYNDQNYYVRTAPTTQGVGIMYRRDFDRLIHKRKPRVEPVDTIKQEAVTDSVPTDSLKVVPQPALEHPLN